MSQKTDYERAALASLQAVASDATASPAARVAAARAVLEHLAPRAAPARRPKAPPGPGKTEAELRDDLAQLRARRAVDGFR
jgi:hypothetical protein